MDDDFVILIVCGMDNCVAFVDVVGNLVWMGAGACIMVGFLDDAVAVDQVAYMHTDALGNIVTVTGNNGEIRLRQATSPFGETITQGLVDNTATGHFQKDDLGGCF
jgi:hypothetical protein